MLNQCSWNLFFKTLGSCDLGRAWADKPWALDSAHSYAECSNRGKCNRNTVIIVLAICDLHIVYSFSQGHM